MNKRMKTFPVYIVETSRGKLTVMPEKGAWTDSDEYDILTSTGTYLSGVTIAEVKATGGDKAKLKALIEKAIAFSCQGLPA